MDEKNEKKRTRNIVIFIAVLVLAVVGYAVYVNVFVASQYPPVYVPKPYDGNTTAKVVITEHADFECPACGSYAEPIVRTLRSEYQDRVAFRFVHFPLSYHTNSLRAAEASECANDQGKFWEYHDKLYENQKRLGDELYYEIAGHIGLDLSSFRQCLESSSKREAVLRDLQESISKNLRGTPSFFVNNVAVDNYAYENFKKIIEQELNK